MGLEPLIARRAEHLRAFRLTVEREQESWRDHRYRSVREQHLEPLAAENARFDREMAEVSAALQTIRRRLEQSRR